MVAAEAELVVQRWQSKYVAGVVYAKVVVKVGRYSCHWSWLPESEVGRQNWSRKSGSRSMSLELLV